LWILLRRFTKNIKRMGFRKLYVKIKIEATGRDKFEDILQGKA
jgi:hypothetical protein